MGNANSATGGGPRDRHKSGDSLPPSSPIGVKEGQAFSFDKRPSVGSHPVTTSSLAQPITGSSNHAKIILQHSHEDDEPFFTQPKSAPTNKHNFASSDDYPEGGRQRALTVSEGTKLGSSNPHHVSKNLPTVFKWDGGGKEVAICGTFSDWKPIPMAKSNFTSQADYVVIVDLPEGEYEYRFQVDGDWRHNPNDPTAETESGLTNNVITVKKTDFEVFDALAMDSISSATNTQHVSGSPPGTEYAQDIPVYKPWEKAAGPPILPPHLLQVILNKDTPLSCEPTLLPEPNHVMLNHLYALSIKDGVMVLSATHRYRKKYVTTLLYKPI
ncbi:unnamed protein product [Orchesella dallaii]|uniref:5'-AMP-activated protein kinase subunit beta-1 n=1 Tax=Orchesella dallaii TaxID=48710 RepID=A0ABP1QTH2_9HEXA